MVIHGKLFTLDSAVDRGLLCPKGEDGDLWLE